MTGLAAGLASGLLVYEAEETPGGICSSYYMLPSGKARLPVSPQDGEALSGLSRTCADQAFTSLGRGSTFLTRSRITFGIWDPK